MAVRPRPPHPVPRFVTIASRPSVLDRTPKNMQLIWFFWKSEFFAKGARHATIRTRSDLPVGAVLRGAQGIRVGDGSHFSDSLKYEFKSIQYSNIRGSFSLVVWRYGKARARKHRGQSLCVLQ